MLVASFRALRLHSVCFDSVYDSVYQSKRWLVQTPRLPPLRIKANPACGDIKCNKRMFLTKFCANGDERQDVAGD